MPSSSETEIGTTSVRLAVAGCQFENHDGSSRQEELRRCRAGEAVALTAEPDNPKHVGAIAVYSCRDIQIGYLRRRDAEWLTDQLMEGTGLSASIVSIAPRARPFDPLVVMIRIECSALQVR
ncbi:HIRAN domain-containing protein [Qipengyuania sp. 6D47A]|uniref:HIRAN domain-containing protein n=1 Tax=Qipengyuania qiaonensis TaxID=2867240 RepID=A0ABS7J3V1_9SPHN|nr:HIRAN domain-containing protein [Qipengyuania qiaonensis]